MWSHLFPRSRDRWIPPDLHGFDKWVFDSLELLNSFFQHVIVSRKDLGIRKWTRWLRRIWVPDRMLGSGLISFPLLHFLSSKTLRLNHSDLR